MPKREWLPFSRQPENSTPGEVAFSEHTSTNLLVDAPMPDSKIQDQNLPMRKVLPLSPHCLLSKKLILPGVVTVSAEKHKGRLVVRVEFPSTQ